MLKYVAEHEGRRDVQVKEAARALQDWQRREGRAEGFQKTLNFLKSIGVSPENMEPFKAMYPDIKTEN